MFTLQIEELSRARMFKRHKLTCLPIKSGKFDIQFRQHVDLTNT